jgi:hypothetical protein
MSPFETFFSVAFVSTASVALLATWYRYLPTLITLYRFLVCKLNQTEMERVAKYSRLAR